MTAASLQPISGTLAGVTFRFNCDVAPLLEYSRMHLAPVIGPPIPLPRIDSTLRWHDGQPPADRLATHTHLAHMERIDRDLYVGGEQLSWFRVDDLRDLFLQLRWKDGRLLVEGDFYYRLGHSRFTDSARRLRQWRRRAALRARRFTTLLAYLVYYPCWWWMEQMTEYHPIHAAAVLTNGGVILLAGASGVGKSTLSTALALAPGNRLLSDSFVLHRGRDVLPVREPVLLDAFARRWLATGDGELQPLKRGYGLQRAGYHFPATRLADGGRAMLLVFPRRSPEPFVRAVRSDDAHRRLSAANLIINDLRRYWAFAAVMEQLVPAGLVARREAQLAQLAAAVPCYDFGVTAEMTSAATVEAILRLTRDEPRRVVNARP